MHAVVCIKQVPDPGAMRIDPETNTLVRAGVPSAINPYDVPGIEAALQLRDEFGGRVSVVSMGPPFFEEALKKAISYGVDDAYLASDRMMGAADTYATSYAVAAVIDRLDREVEPVDIVFCGRQTTDSDTGQVGPGIAQRLGIPLLTYVMNIKSVNADDGTIICERKLETGREVIEAELPALITAEKGLAKPRYASLPDMLRARDYEITMWDAEALGLEKTDVGLRGSPTIVAKSFTPPVKEAGEMIDTAEHAPEEAVERLLDQLTEDGVTEILAETTAE